MSTDDLLAEAESFLRASANGLRKANVPESEIEDYLQESIAARLAASLRASEAERDEWHRSRDRAVEDAYVLQRRAEAAEQRLAIARRDLKAVSEGFEAAEARIARLEGALREAPPFDRLRALADWLDEHDRKMVANELGVSPAEVPDYMVSTQGEVQRDLRHFADALAALDQGDEREACP